MACPPAAGSSRRCRPSLCAARHVKLSWPAAEACGRAARGIAGSSPVVAAGGDAAPVSRVRPKRWLWKNCGAPLSSSCVRWRGSPISSKQLVHERLAVLGEHLWWSGPLLCRQAHLLQSSQLLPKGWRVALRRQPIGSIEFGHEAVVARPKRRRWGRWQLLGLRWHNPPNALLLKPNLSRAHTAPTRSARGAVVGGCVCCAHVQQRARHFLRLEQRNRPKEPYLWIRR